jgi:hypothetical protein
MVVVRWEECGEERGSLHAHEVAQRSAVAINARILPWQRQENEKRASPGCAALDFIFLNTNLRQTSPVLFTSRNNKLFQCPRSGLKRDSERTPRHPNRPFQRVLGLQFNRNWAMRLALTLVVLTEKRSVTITSDHDRASHHWHVGALFGCSCLADQGRNINESCNHSRYCPYYRGYCWVRCWWRQLHTQQERRRRRPASGLPQRDKHPSDPANSQYGIVDCRDWACCCGHAKQCSLRAQ